MRHETLAANDNQFRLLCMACTAIIALQVGVGMTVAGEPEKSMDKLPAGAEVLDRFIKVTGGEAAYKKIKNRITQLTMDFNVNSISGEMIVYEAAPNKRYTRFTAESVGPLETGTDGEHYWSRNGQNPPRLLDGAARAAAQRESLFLPDLNWRKLFDTAECVGIADVNGKPCYKVSMKAKDGADEFRLFDKESGLLRKRSARHGSAQNNSVKWERYYDDYKEVDGILIPHHTRVLLGGDERNMVINSIKQNQELPEDRFATPADVLAAAEKQRARTGRSKARKILLERQRKQEAEAKAKTESKKKEQAEDGDKTKKPDTDPAPKEQDK